MTLRVLWDNVVEEQVKPISARHEQTSASQVQEGQDKSLEDEILDDNPPELKQDDQHLSATTKPEGSQFSPVDEHQTMPPLSSTQDRQVDSELELPIKSNDDQVISEHPTIKLSDSDARFVASVHEHPAIVTYDESDEGSVLHIDPDDEFLRQLEAEKPSAAGESVIQQLESDDPKVQTSDSQLRKFLRDN